MQVKLCECGCGLPAPIAQETRKSIGHFKGRPVRFVRGHANKGRHLPPRNGGLSPWGDEGRTQICCRDGSKVFFYRAVMEAHLKRHLTSDEIVHHINEDPSDDRLENLELTTRAEHVRKHLPTHCKRGHSIMEGDGDVYVTPEGHRYCRACIRIRAREYRERKAAA